MRNLIRNLYGQRAYLRRIERAYQRLKSVELLSEADVASLAEETRVQFLQFCIRHVPYYRGLAAKLDIGGFEDWTKLPILTKDIIRGHEKELRSEGYSSLWIRKNTSGGSTGEPVTFLQDDAYQVDMCAMKRVYDAWTGYHYGESKVILWGSERDLLEGREHWKTHFARWMQHEHWINAFRMTEESMAAAVELINKSKPVQILAYVEAISTLCKYIKTNNLSVHSPKAIMTSAGTLYPEIRKEISETFNAPVYNRYGSREVGDMGSEYAAGSGLLVHPSVHYLEVVREDGSLCQPGEPGRILVSCFTNRVMPLLRYDVGDVGVMHPVRALGMPAYQSLESVKGRVTDNFITSEGARIHGEFFTHLLYHRDWVQKFRFHQRADTSIDIYVVLTPHMKLTDVQEQCEQIESQIQQVMGEVCPLRWSALNKLESHGNGKYRYVISDMPQ